MVEVDLDQVDEAEVVYFQVPPRMKGVNLQARAGEIVGLAGMQGQGQAEFLRAVYGMLLYNLLRSKSPLW
ncbi:hypothetical protein MOTE_01870 [Moorella thermoacetica]|uniref:Uncharacterized protein n=1 Tax=Neomoorella thermoacetica TaxID=1525 RepID=A0A1J5P132_NEOTH|nr:hypothetical protein MOTE_01870 [Moorella thermoacetica]